LSPERGSLSPRERVGVRGKGGCRLPAVRIFPDRLFVERAGVRCSVLLRSRRRPLSSFTERVC
jgi:hypothetical protein